MALKPIRSLKRIWLDTSAIRHFGTDKPWRTVFAWKAKGSRKRIGSVILLFRHFHPVRHASNGLGRGYFFTHK